MFILRGAILFYFILFLVANFCLAKERVSSKANANKGAEFFFLAEEHFEEGDYWTASELFWKAILFPSNQRNILLYV
jgi:hypothetical protein